jgi:hypothetical protein
MIVYVFVVEDFLTVSFDFNRKIGNFLLEFSLLEGKRLLSHGAASFIVADCIF